MREERRFSAPAHQGYQTAVQPRPKAISTNLTNKDMILSNIFNFNYLTN